MLLLPHYQWMATDLIYFPKEKLSQTSFKSIRTAGEKNSTLSMCGVRSTATLLGQTS